jgi:hypothetical protein
VDVFNGDVGEGLIVVADDLVSSEQTVLGGGVAVRDEVDVVADNVEASRSNASRFVSRNASDHRLDAKVSRLRVESRVQRPPGLGAMQRMGGN